MQPVKGINIDKMGIPLSKLRPRWSHLPRDTDFPEKCQLNNCRRSVTITYQPRASEFCIFVVENQIKGSRL